MNGVTTSRLS